LLAERLRSPLTDVAAINERLDDSVASSRPATNPDLTRKDLRRARCRGWRSTGAGRAIWRRCATP
jgi:hypothetical protein